MHTGGHAVVADRSHAKVDASKGSFPLDFFVLVFGLSIPFWLLGKSKLPLEINLPTGALVTFVPGIAATIVCYRRFGMKGVKDLWKRVLDFRKFKNKVWFLPILFTMPLIYFLAYVVMRLTGMPLPDQVVIPLASIPAYLLMFFIGDTFEELGWMGYAIDPMQDRWGALKGSLMFSAVLATWHAIPWVLTGNAPSWILWQTLSVFPLRILHVWVYNNTGRSVFAVILFHDMNNMSWTLFPNYGSHYDPFVTGVITVIAAILVVLGWGPKTLANFRFGRKQTAQLNATS
jgi:hypothetical protein